MKKTSNISIVLLCLCLGLDVWLILNPEYGNRLYTKPLLLIFLLVYLLSNVKKTKPVFAVVIALLFSWLGDILLLKKDFFIYGLLAFFVAHICYLVFFLKLGVKSGRKGMVQLYPHTLIPLIVYNIVYLSILLPRTGDVPVWSVLLYGFIIAATWITSINLFNKIALSAAKYLSIGMTFFVISDSLLAYTLFVAPMVFVQALVMITYVAAQWLLVKGVLQTQQMDVNVVNGS